MAKLESPPIGDPLAPSYVYAATIYRIVDGDTLWCRVDLGFYVTRIVDVRCRGYNAPERNAPGGAAATTFLAQILAGGFTLQSHKLASGAPSRSFDRWVADIFLADGRPLADVMIAAGHGVPEGDS